MAKSKWAYRLYRFKNFLKGRESYYVCDYRGNTVTKGNEGTDWTFIPGLLSPGDIVYSFGAGKDISFDRALVEELGLKVYLFDPTPESVDFIRILNLEENYIFEDTGLAGFDGKTRFYLPDEPGYVSATMQPKHEDQRYVEVRVERLKTIMKRNGHKKIDLLKMDIEGAEYEVIDDILDSGIWIGQWLIEFHHRFPMNGIAKTRRAVSRLRDAGYKLFNVSATGEELSFVNRELVK